MLNFKNAPQEILESFNIKQQPQILFFYRKVDRKQDVQKEKFDN